MHGRFTLAPVLPLFLLLFLAAGGCDDDARRTPSTPLPSTTAVRLDPNETVDIRTVLALDDRGGAWIRRAVRLAIHHVGPVAGRTVDLGEPVDGGCSALGGERAAGAVAGDGAVLGVIGTLCPASAAAALPVLSAAGIPLVSPADTSPALTSDLTGTPGADHRPGYFRTAVNERLHAAAAARFAYEELGLTRTAAVHDGGAYGNGLTSTFERVFEALGGTVAAVVRVLPGQQDFERELDDLHVLADLDGVYYPLFPETAVPFTEQIRRHPAFYDIVLIADAVVLDRRFLESRAAEGVYVTAPAWPHPHQTNVITGKNAGQVLDELAALYPETPDDTAWASAYDAAVWLLYAIHRVAADEGGTLVVDRRALGDYLATDRVQGITGTLSCDPFGDCAGTAVHVYHHSDSYVVHPADLEIVYTQQP